MKRIDISARRKNHDLDFRNFINTHPVLYFKVFNFIDRFPNVNQLISRGLRADGN